MNNLFAIDNTHVALGIGLGDPYELNEHERMCNAFPEKRGRKNRPDKRSGADTTLSETYRKFLSCTSTSCGSRHEI